MTDAGEPGDEPDEGPPGPGQGRPPPPSLTRVLAVGALILVLVLATPALYAAGRDLTGSPLVGILGLLPPALAVAWVYRSLFR